MTNLTRAAGLALLIGLTVGSAARAQPHGHPPGSPFGGPGRASSPTFSPYLNLLRPGNQAVNYYGLVRPQQEFRSGLESLQQQYNTLNREVNTPSENGPAGLPATGHAVTFMNTGRYFSGGFG